MVKFFQERQSRSGRLAIRILGSLVIVGGLFALMVFTVPQGNTVPNEANTTTKIDDAARRCEDQLADLIEGLTPGRLGISSDRVQIIDRLNIWRTECGAQIGDARPSSDLALIEQQLQGELKTRTLSERYLADDAAHIRMCLLARDIVTSIVEGQTSNSKRAVALFDFVSRNVMLVNDEIRATTPLTAYESLVFGMGTAEDRAWIFAELLRQLRMDVVILTPRAEKLAGEWLVGVIDPQGEILLFDSRLGLPIPAADSADDTAYPNQAATLQSVRESDAAFRKLDLPGSPYPLGSQDMAELNVSLIGSSSGWAPRMALLQFLLPSGISVDLYDGLGANELRSPGAYQRIVDAGKNAGWTEQQVSIWPYSEQARAAFEATRGEGEENSQLAGLQVVFRGPYVPRPVGEDGKTFQPTPIDKSLHFVRIEQLKGKYSNAIRDYLPIRTTVKQIPSPANESAAEFATLWTGVSQYQTQKIRTALGTFDRYVTGQARSMGMSRVAIEFLADCLLIQKNYEAAVQVLEKAPPGFAPRRDQYLIHRWQKIGGIKPDQSAPATPEKPDSKSAGEMKASDQPADAKSQGDKPADSQPADAKPEMGNKPAADASPKPESGKTPPAEKEKKSAPPPTADKPTTDKPTTDKPTTDKPTTDKPTADKPTADKPTADKPTADKPTADKPAAEKTEKPQSADEKPASDQDQQDSKPETPVEK